MRRNRWWGVLAPLCLLASVLAWAGVSGAQPFAGSDGLEARFVAPETGVVTEPLRYGTIQVEVHDSHYGTANGDGIRGVRLRVSDDATGRVVARRTEYWPTYDFGPQLADGTYTLEATAYSRSGERTTIRTSLTVNTSGDPLPPPTTTTAPPTTPDPTPISTTTPTRPTTRPTTTAPPSDGTTTYSLTFVPAPGVTSDGTGSVTAVLTEATRRFTVEGSYRGMTGPERGLHIHTYPSQLDVGSTPGPVPGSGTIGRTYTLSVAHVEALRAGAFEMNIHTSTYPDGELQGTLRPVNPTTPTTVAPRPTTSTVNPTNPTNPTTTGPTPTTPTTTGPTSTTRPGPDDPDPGLENVDGSPKAPRPGTVAPPADAPRSMAYGIWKPSEHDTCSKEIHDKYWVYGPDSKVYPTWHPPVDPTTGCTFGHEHGRDPAGSDLSDIPFPFGYVNERAMATGTVHRHEDHVGHKIEWYNNGGYYNNGNSSQNHDVICDVAYKMHQGSHSADAFSNNLHEVFNYARCENGSEFIYRALHPFGNKGEFNMHCNQSAGEAVPFGDRTGGTDDTGGSGTREIPARECFEDRVLVGQGQRTNWHAFDERWTLYQNDDSDDFGRFFIQFYFFVDLPSRYWDGAGLARTVDLCYETGARRVRDDRLCEPMHRANPGRRVRWDDPASPFNGADRQVFMVDIRLDNRAGQTDWYTDIHGSNWSATPFPGSIEQYVGTTPIRAAASYRPSPIRSIDFADNLDLHAPN